MKKTTATHCKKPPKHFFNPGKPPLTASKTRAFPGDRVFLPPDAPSVWFPIFSPHLVLSPSANVQHGHPCALILAG
jgi:hypothetical protein